MNAAPIRIRRSHRNREHYAWVADGFEHGPTCDHRIGKSDTWNTRDIGYGKTRALSIGQHNPRLTGLHGNRNPCDYRIAQSSAEYTNVCFHGCSGTQRKPHSDAERAHGALTGHRRAQSISGSPARASHTGCIRSTRAPSKPLCNAERTFDHLAASSKTRRFTLQNHSRHTHRTARNQSTESKHPCEARP